MASNLEKWFNSDAVFKNGLDEFYFFFIGFCLRLSFSSNGIIFLKISKGVYSNNLSCICTKTDLLTIL